LYVEGKAFEDDSERLVQAAENGSTIQVVPSSGDYESDEVLNLKVQSVANEIDQQSRALKFYLLLPNKLTSKRESGTSNNSFISWKFRPGQRMEAKIPTTQVMKNKIVLPPDAVVIEGPNAFVFEQNGDNFDRIDVHVLYRDKDTVVLENDGQLVGSSIAMNGAYQMHLALKNQSGGAIDPHAGHNH
jgi:multidrug efflux pump subunit AcrA (membrane-fusion protein)